MTFTLDDATAEELNVTSSRLKKPKSQVIREAIHDYHLKSDRLSESERCRIVRILKEHLQRPPMRTQQAVDREIAEIRAARRSRGRLHPVD